MLKIAPGRSPALAPALTRRSRRESVAIAIVGCGYWGSKHVRVLSSMPTVSQIFAVDGDPKIRQQIAKDFPGVTTAEDLIQVLNSVDGVIVATPPHNHVEIALKALRAGKGVLIEKPIATSLQGAQRLQNAALLNDAPLVAGHTYEFNPVLHDLKRRIDAGELGDIRYLHSARLNLGLYRADVSVVWDLAPHDISIMNYLMAETPAEVRAWGISCAGKGIIDVAQFQLVYPTRGVVATCSNSWIDPRRVRQLTVVGSRKMAVFDDASDEKLKIYDHSVSIPDDFNTAAGGLQPLPVAYCRGDVVVPKVDQREPLQIEDRHFVELLLDPVKYPSGANTGIDVVRVLEAIDQSIRSGKPVQVKTSSGRKAH